MVRVRALPGLVRVAAPEAVHRATGHEAQLSGAPALQAISDPHHLLDERGRIGPGREAFEQPLHHEVEHPFMFSQELYAVFGESQAVRPVIATADRALHD